MSKVSIGKNNISSGSAGFLDGKHLKVTDAAYKQHPFTKKDGTSTYSEHGPVFTFQDLTDGSEHTMLLRMNQWARDNSKPSADGTTLETSIDNFKISGNCEYGRFLASFYDMGGNEEVPGENIKAFIGTEFIVGYLPVTNKNPNTGEEKPKNYFIVKELKGSSSSGPVKQGLNTAAVANIKSQILAAGGKLNKGQLLVKMVQDVEARGILSNDGKIRQGVEEGHWQFTNDELIVV